MTKRYKIAVIGAGISGLGASWLLSKKHDVTVFEAEPDVGGHANTVIARTPDGNVSVDTGFIVCNDRNYPNFLSLMNQIDIDLYPTEMSFAVSMNNGSFEYAGSDKLSDMLAQPSNLVRPRFWRMIKSLLRFYKNTSTMDPSSIGKETLRDYLSNEGYDPAFLRDHILPMAAAIWSTPSSKVGDFPLKSFLRFCQNHGLLQIDNRPQWYTVPGGSRAYVNALISHSQARIKTNAAIEKIERRHDSVLVSPHKQEPEVFDRVLIATHANTANHILHDTDTLEEEILGSFSYAKNTAVLHSDPSFMPKRKRAWASWNYLQEDTSADNRLSVTYWMNKLQPLETETPLFVTLNPARRPAHSHIFYEKEYEHPIFDPKSANGQRRLNEIMGHRNIWYAGAHFGYGFHEDGLQSGLYAAEQMGGVARPWFHPDMNSRIIALENTNDHMAAPLTPPREVA